jgi:hypothetical protein
LSHSHVTRICTNVSRLACEALVRRRSFIGEMAARQRLASEPANGGLK